MQIQTLKLRNLRNIESLSIQPGAGFNIFSGNNGHGKTNVLESVYVACSLRSFRTQSLSELVKFGENTAFISAVVRRSDVERNYEVSIIDKSRRVRLDGKPVSPIAKYFGKFNVVVFTPGDLQVARDSPSLRRKFIDRAVFNVDSEYLQTVQAHRKIIRSRNALLKKRAIDRTSLDSIRSLLEVYDEQAVTIGTTLIKKRASYIEKMSPIVRQIFEDITKTGRQVGVEYKTCVSLTSDTSNASHIEEELRNAMKEKISEDVARCVTSIGPHRDDMLFLFDGRPAASYASQGQLRALILSWKCAEMTLLAKELEEAPVFLLDDVSSELDQNRNEYLFDFLAKGSHQCFITTTHPSHVLVRKNRIDFNVLDGVIRPQNTSA